MSPRCAASGIEWAQGDDAASPPRGPGIRMRLLVTNSVVVCRYRHDERRRRDRRAADVPPAHARSRRTRANGTTPTSVCSGTRPPCRWASRWRSPRPPRWPELVFEPTGTPLGDRRACPPPPQLPTGTTIFGFHRHVSAMNSTPYSRFQHDGRAARLRRDARRQMLADLAHEIRTPVSVIDAYIESLEDGVHPLDEDHHRHAARPDPTARPIQHRRHLAGGRSTPHDVHRRALDRTGRV